MSATCETCRWWNRGVRQDGSPRDVGGCRRYPPRIRDRREDGDYWLDPITPRDGWCGEHKKKEPTP